MLVSEEDSPTIDNKQTDRQLYLLFVMDTIQGSALITILYKMNVNVLLQNKYTFCLKQLP